MVAPEATAVAPVAGSEAGAFMIKFPELTAVPPEYVLVADRVVGPAPECVTEPVPLMELAAKVLKKQSEFRRLTGSLIVDSVKIQKELGWTPIKGLRQKKLNGS